MIVFGNKYEYLRVTKEEALSIIHPESYIQEFDGKTRKRRIFQDVPYNDFENQKLKEIEQTCFEQKLNHAVLQQKGQLLKFLYSNKFDIQKTYENLKLYIQWLMDPKTFQLNNVSKQYLEKGFAYLGGRDKQYRPSIIFDVPKMLSVELKLEEILPVFNTILWMAQEYQFYNKHIENWQVIIQTNYLGLLNFPFKLFDQISKSSTIYFPVNLENIFILHPSNSLKLSWNLVKPFIPKESQEKIQFLDGDDVKKQFLKVFNPDQLEQKYGGSVTDLVNYFPPYDFRKGIYIQNIQTNQIQQNNESKQLEQNNQSFQKQQNSQYPIIMENQQQSLQPQVLYQSRLSAHYNNNNNDQIEYEKYKYQKQYPQDTIQQSMHRVSLKNQNYIQNTPQIKISQNLNQYQIKQNDQNLNNNNQENNILQNIDYLNENNYKSSYNYNKIVQSQNISQNYQINYFNNVPQNYQDTYQTNYQYNQMNINSSVNPYYSVQGNYNSSKGRPYDSVKYKQQNNCDPTQNILDDDNKNIENNQLKFQSINYNSASYNYAYDYDNNYTNKKMQEHYNACVIY